MIDGRGSGSYDQEGQVMTLREHCENCKSSECTEHPLVCRMEQGVREYFNKTSKVKNTLRDRCEKVFEDISECADSHLQVVDEIESFALQIEAETLERAIQECALISFKYGPQGCIDAIRALAQKDEL